MTETVGAGGTLTIPRVSFTRLELAKALDDHLPRMAFRQYGQFYNDDPDFDVVEYYERVADAIFREREAAGGTDV